ncbi:serine/threonine-protein phosphatase [Novosphingobium sp. ERN07]|uniref:PP2C family protein-serine/threonine phosphatase n=1 Tax=Novosphingobium sp. ERN07 TaxID=2726187 RepID=UPI0014566E42|nr:protein phosphatase 2C domain-containing protein [Novosphingobium sp. ERN07]NLR72729.1 serine/threonine-protein phosphatase [Novosphingobium sp. ERN07]
MTNTFRIEDNALSHVGKVRSQNEDSHFTDPEAGVWLVADGMGGHTNGKLASEALAAAVGAVRVPDALDAACTVVANAIHSANTAIFGHAQEAGVQMGSTVVALVVRGDEFAVLWAGDSRAYLHRDGQLIQLTRDHTQVQEMVDRGLLDPADVEDHPMKHVLSRAVGVQDTLEIDAIRDQLQTRDLFLLCSDGLYGVVGEAEIARIVTERGIAAGEDLIEASLAGGAPDNITVALVSVTEPTLLVLNGASS